MAVFVMAKTPALQTGLYTWGFHDLKVAVRQAVPLLTPFDRRTLTEAADQRLRAQLGEMARGQTQAFLRRRSA